MNLFDIAYPHRHRRFIVSQFFAVGNTLGVPRDQRDVSVAKWEQAI
ncbi:hypothetical protein [Bradyrhizobium liaoningense]|nr:hypothetical protein [Bradyrhizobium liaoningense]MBR0716367.1 hypothetical protein [Bradyrhizobium liaoningense]